MKTSKFSADARIPQIKNAFGLTKNHSLRCGFYAIHQGYPAGQFVFLEWVSRTNELSEKINHENNQYISAADSSRIINR